jgi:hypothetical protein
VQSIQQDEDRMPARLGRHHRPKGQVHLALGPRILRRLTGVHPAPVKAADRQLVARVTGDAAWSRALPPAVLVAPSGTAVRA